MPKSASDRLDTQITPEPALEKRSRRQFVPEYKLRIIAQADACKYGELGALRPAREALQQSTVGIGGVSMLKTALQGCPCGI